MKRFIKLCLVFCVPFMIWVVYYAILDPFKVIKHYDLYYQPDDIIGINRGFASTMHYINHKDEYNYDSFIFGNSRSSTYYEEEWKKYIPKSSICYHFDASGGSVGGVYYKIKYIDEHGGDIKYALLVLDHHMLNRTEQTGHLYLLPPVLIQNKNYLKFQWENLSCFFNVKFVWAVIDFKMHNKYKRYMGKYIKDKKWSIYDGAHYDPVNNEIKTWLVKEESIARGDYYDEEVMKKFKNAQFPDKNPEVVIDEERLEMLKSIKSIFDSHLTKYKIVISPLYDQIKLNSKDLQSLYDVFGQENVFDFSGVNQWTSDYHNYYENSHYRICVANDILRLIYKE